MSVIRPPTRPVAMTPSFGLPSTSAFWISIGAAAAIIAWTAVAAMAACQVLVLPSKMVEAGARRSVELSALTLASGTYLYRLETPQGSFTRHLTLLK